MFFDNFTVMKSKNRVEIAFSMQEVISRTADGCLCGFLEFNYRQMFPVVKIGNMKLQLGNFGSMNEFQRRLAWRRMIINFQRCPRTQILMRSDLLVGMGFQSVGAHKKQSENISNFFLI